LVKAGFVIGDIRSQGHSGFVQFLVQRSHLPIVDLAPQEIAKLFRRLEISILGALQEADQVRPASKESESRIISGGAQPQTSM